jgi:hypothetical protein
VLFALTATTGGFILGVVIVIVAILVLYAILARLARRLRGEIA